MKRVGVCRARQGFSGLVNRVRFRGERFILVRHGREVAALVPVKDVGRLWDLEVRMHADALCGPDATAEQRAAALTAAEEALQSG